MKPRRIGLAVVAVLGIAGVLACRPPRDRSDWRAPAGVPRSCATDADCPGGTACAIELGATQGTCTPDGDGGVYPYGPARGGEGGLPRPRGPQPPPFDVQPSPGDINI